MKYIRSAGLGLLLLVLLSTCTDAGASIFYSIEIEEKIANKALSDFLTAERAVHLPNYVPADNTTFLAAGSLFALDMDSPDQDWSEIFLPGGYRYTWQIAGDGNATLYAVLENRDGDAAALYEFDGTTWTASTAVFTGRPSSVWFVNGTLFLMTVEEKSDGDYFAYRLYSGTDVTDVSTLVDIPAAIEMSDVTDGSITPFRDIDYDIANTTYWYITAATLLNGSAAVMTEDGTAPAGRSFRRLYYVTGSAAIATGMYISTVDEGGDDGAVYRYDGSWNGPYTAGTDPNDFGLVNFNGQDYLLLGEENGYLESSAGSAFSGESVTIESNYDNTGLGDTVVNALIDGFGTGDSFYALTSSFGLWRNTDGDWDLE